MTSETNPPAPRKRKPRPTPTAPYIGGPLDGQTYRKHSSGVWSLYRTNEGEHLVPRKGDAIMRAGDPAGCYILREELDEAAETWRPVYRHTSTLPSRTVEPPRTP